MKMRGNRTKENSTREGDTVYRTLRTQGSLAPGSGAQLAAGAGALALALMNQSEDGNGVAIFSAGSRDNQCMILSRLGLRPVSGIAPVASTEYDDVIRVMYCANTEGLQSRFRSMMDAMAETMGIGSEPVGPGSNSLKASFMKPRYLCGQL